ncbi:hypothetical protein TNCV_2578351 [Trichonephila clavipes]|nr:hypothetical protein TNCV_2578351 [Trichonephila clavipes]
MSRDRAHYPSRPTGRERMYVKSVESSNILPLVEYVTPTKLTRDVEPLLSGRCQDNYSTIGLSPPLAGSLKPVVCGGRFQKCDKEVVETWMSSDAEDCGFQMLNDDEIVTSVQSDYVDDEADEDEDNNNDKSSKCPSNVDAFSALETAMEGDEAHFWLNGYVNKQNCRIWSEANPQVYVETPLHPEKLIVWCALWAGGILLQKR